jgi:hypothetical protein
MKPKKFMVWVGLGTAGSITGKIALKFSLVALLLGIFTAVNVYAQAQFFGVLGRSGVDGRFGRNGLSGQEPMT